MEQLEPTHINQPFKKINLRSFFMVNHKARTYFVSLNSQKLNQKTNAIKVKQNQHIKQ